MARKQPPSAQMIKSWVKMREDGMSYAQIARAQKGKRKYHEVTISNHVRRVQKQGDDSHEESAKRNANGITTLMVESDIANRVRRLATLTGQTQTVITSRLIQEGLETHCNHLITELNKL